MGLLNYTTTISVETTLSEIHSTLVSAGATQILNEYDGAKNIVSVSFKIQTAMGMMTFRLPMRVEAIAKILNKQVDLKQIPKKFRNDVDQARRVGWRIIRQWLTAQLAIIETGMVSSEEVFLPYAQNKEGRTFFELIREGGVNLLTN